jgi:hypothetical protein
MAMHEISLYFLFKEHFELCSVEVSSRALFQGLNDLVGVFVFIGCGL